MSTTATPLGLDHPDLRRFWGLVRERLERYGVDRLGTMVVGLDREEGDAVAGLFASRRSYAGRRQIDLGRLDLRLRASPLQCGLVELLERMGGPVRDRRAERAEAEQARRELWESAAAHPALRKHPQLEDWLDSIRRNGTITRRGDPALLASALGVLEQLPADGIMLGALAARHCGGDAHALDPGQPVSGLVLPALAHLAGRKPPTSSLARRELWVEFGVNTDTLSATVLVLNLRPDSEGPLAGTLRAFAQLGEPVSITLSQLQQEPLRFGPDHPAVLICENPAVMDEAKSALGPASGPLICVAGRHNTAASRLLSALREAGIELRYHGDFDWGGIRIANELVARFGVRPWLLGADDYQTFLEFAPPLPLQGRPVSASWDPELSKAMIRARVAIQEESILDRLLRGLGQAS